MPQVPYPVAFVPEIMGGALRDAYLTDRESGPPLSLRAWERRARLLGARATDPGQGRLSYERKGGYCDPKAIPPQPWRLLGGICNQLEPERANLSLNTSKIA